MPLKFLLAIKAKHAKLKNRSKSTTDLLQAKKQELSTESAQMMPTEGGLIKKSQSKPYLRYSSKENAQEPLKRIKEKKDKSCADLRDTKKAESQTGSQGSRANSLQYTDKVSLDHNGNSLIVPQLRTSKSASSFSATDENSRERRLSDMALLDQYIDYHQRKAADDGSNTTRLVCAQLLRESFLRVEQRQLGDTQRSTSKHDLSRSVTNLNQMPSITARTPQYQKNTQRRLSTMVGLSQQQSEPRLSLGNADTRKSMTSLDSPDKYDEGPIQFSCKVSSDDMSIENYRDIRTRKSSTDNFRDLFKKPKSMAKRRSVPDFTQQEIEIF